MYWLPLIVRKHCTLLRHEYCLLSWLHDEPKPCPLSAHKSWYAYTCIVTTSVLFYCYLVGFQKSCCEWLRFIVCDQIFQNLFPVSFLGIFVQIENSLFHRGDLNNNDNNIGLPVRKYWNSLWQYFLASSSRKSNIRSIVCFLILSGVFCAFFFKEAADECGRYMAEIHDLQLKLHAQNDLAFNKFKKAAMVSFSWGWDKRRQDFINLCLRYAMW